MQFRWLWLVLMVLGIGVHAAHGDVVVLTDNQRFPTIHVDSFATVGGVGAFQMRAIRDGIIDAIPYPVEETTVSQVEFRNPGDTSPRPAGRVGTLVLLDGRRFESVWVESCARENGVMTFQVRQAGVPPGGQAFPVPMNVISTLAFIPMNLPTAIPPTPTPMEMAPTPPPAMPGFEGEGQSPEAQMMRNPYDTYPQAPPPPAPTPANIRMGGEMQQIPPELMPQQPPAGQPPPQQIAMLSTPTPVAALEGSEEMAEGETPEGDEFASAFSENEPPPTGAKKKFSSDDDSDFTYRGGRSQGFSIMVFGYYVGILSVLASMLVVFVVGGAILFFTTRTENIKDFNIGKAILTSALLTVFPTLCLFLCIRFIPIFGLWAGLAAWYFSGRAIVMGMLEVLEAQAATILFWYCVFFVLAIWLSLKYM